jgi:membrane-associated phospholipid phosphatase
MAPAPAFYARQLAYLRSYADLRADRIGEIDLQKGDMLSFFGLLGMLNESRRKHTLELLAAVVRLAILVEMPLKHYCRSPRPIDYSNRVMPVIQTPDHSTFPSGHAIEAFAAATVLSHLYGTHAGDKPGVLGLPFQIAHRIAVNRTVAGVHFPVDSLAGALIGCRIGEEVRRLALGLPPLPEAGLGRGKDPETLISGSATFAATEDFSLAALNRLHKPDAAAGTPGAGVLGRLWQNALDEWAVKPAGQ